MRGSALRNILSVILFAVLFVGERAGWAIYPLTPVDPYPKETVIRFEIAPDLSGRCVVRLVGVGVERMPASERIWFPVVGREGNKTDGMCSIECWGPWVAFSLGLEYHGGEHTTATLHNFRERIPGRGWHIDEPTTITVTGPIGPLGEVLCDVHITSDFRSIIRPLGMINGEKMVQVEKTSKTLSVVILPAKKEEGAKLSRPEEKFLKSMCFEVAYKGRIIEADVHARRLRGEHLLKWDYRTAEKQGLRFILEIPE